MITKSPVERLQKSLLEWFRDLGVAYFYERKQVDGLLESLRVLNPVWLTNGIYRLILRAGKNVHNGELTHQAIRKILKTSYKGDAEENLSYKPAETEYILHVMRMFEISHEIQEGLELIPMLMKKDAKKMDPFSNEAIHLRWEGAFLPNNLIHRLMIQKHKELDTDFMWRTGARFHSTTSPCTAAAVMRDDKSLDLYVMDGDDDEQREYLNSFRERIKDILYSMNLRETEEYICCTVNGKEGKVLYDDVVFAYKAGERILIPGIREFASPAGLLKRVEKNPERLLTSEPERIVIHMPPIQYNPVPSEPPKPEEKKPDQPPSSETGEKETKQLSPTDIATIKEKEANTRNKNVQTFLVVLGILLVLILLGFFVYDVATGKNPGITMKELIELLSKLS